MAVLGCKSGMEVLDALCARGYQRKSVEARPIQTEVRLGRESRLLTDFIGSEIVVEEKNEAQTVVRRATFHTEYIFPPDEFRADPALYPPYAWQDAGCIAEVCRAKLLPTSLFGGGLAPSSDPYTRIGGNIFYRQKFGVRQGPAIAIQMTPAQSVWEDKATPSCSPQQSPQSTPPPSPRRTEMDAPIKRKSQRHRATDVASEEHARSTESPESYEARQSEFGAPALLESLVLPASQSGSASWAGIVAGKRSCEDALGINTDCMEPSATRPTPSARDIMAEAQQQQLRGLRQQQIQQEQQAVQNADRDLMLEAQQQQPLTFCSNGS